MREDKNPIKIIVKLKSIYTRQYNKSIKCYSSMNIIVILIMIKKYSCIPKDVLLIKRKLKVQATILFGFIDIVCPKQTSCRDIQL